MKRNMKEVYDKLPGSWAELKFKDFKKILDIPVSESDEMDGIFNGQDNSIKTLSVLSGVSVEELYQVDLVTITALTNKIDFIMVEPDPKQAKSSLKWKEIDKISYGEYITFVMLSQQPFKNLDLLIQAFSLEELTTDQIQELSMLEVYAGFFTLNQTVEKYMKTMARKTTMQIARLTAKEQILTPLRQRWNQLTRRFKKRMVGTSQ
jgi:hypothetical protein